MTSKLGLIVGPLAALPFVGQFARIWPVLDIINMVLPAIGLALLLCLASCLWKRRRALALISALGLALSGWHITAHILSAAPLQSGKPKVTALTTSAYRANSDPARFVLQLAKSQADLIFVQEADGAAAAQLASIWPGYFRAHSCNAPPCSLMILSRWPLSRLEPPVSEDSPMADLLAARVEAPIGTFTAITVHLPRPHLPTAAPHRQQLIKAIRQAAGEPLLLGGDFNLPTGSLVLSDLAKNGFVRRLDGYVSTYPASFPTQLGLPIDHLFVSPEWRSHGCEPVSLAGSDHRAVQCALSLPTEPEAGTKKADR